MPTGKKHDMIGGKKRKGDIDYERNAVPHRHPYRQPGRSEPPGRRHTGKRQLRGRRGHPGHQEAPQPPGAAKAHGQLPRAQQGLRRAGHPRPPPGRRELRPDHRCRHPRRQRPRRGPGAPVRRKRRGRSGHPRLLRPHHRPGDQRTADGAVRLRGVPAGEQGPAEGSRACWARSGPSSSTRRPTASAPPWTTSWPPSGTGGSPCAGS